MFKGYNIGRVKEFTLTDSNKVDAQIIIYDGYQDKITEGSVFSKSGNPFTGASSIEFYEGPDISKKVPVGSFLPSLDSPEGKLLMAGKDYMRTSEIMFSLLSNLNTLLESMNRTDSMKDGVLYTLLINGARASQDLTETVAKLNGLFDQLIVSVANNQSSLNQTLSGVIKVSNNLSEVSQKLVTTLSGADSLIYAYKKPEGLIRNMIDPGGGQIFTPAEKLIKGLDSLTNEFSGVGHYINSQSAEISLVLDNINTTLLELRKTLQGLNNSPLLRYGIDPVKDTEKTGQKIRQTEIE